MGVFIMAINLELLENNGILHSHQFCLNLKRPTAPVQVDIPRDSNTQTPELPQSTKLNVRGSFPCHPGSDISYL